MKSLFVIMFSLVYTTISAQITLKGVVTDENHTPLSGAHIHSKKSTALSDIEGNFSISDVPNEPLRVYISYIGYQSLDTVINPLSNQTFIFQLKPDNTSLEEVLITQGISVRNTNKLGVEKSFIQKNYSGSLAKSLEQLPGINSMEIGAGASKPIIRGLGFNRVVVAENNTKHEGQQWGADHGLEIDAFTAETIEIIKNSGSIEYGSDAIGGVINVKNDMIPEKNSLTGNYTILGKSVNQGILNHLQINYRKNHFFYKLKATTNDYGDYSLPTDTIVYLTVQMPVYKQQLKNTAGRERNIFGQVGYVSDYFQSLLTVSNTYSKSGFFPGSHGIPSIDRVQDDGNDRNIDYPYQSANHFKLNSGNTWFFEKSNLRFALSFQNNKRNEFSEFHTHYTNQQPPDTQPDLELSFDLSSVESHLKYSYRFSKNNFLNIGVQQQYQKNNIAGYGFLLPEFEKNTLGGFVVYDHTFLGKINFNAGIRYDWAALKTEAYYDTLLYDYLIAKGYPYEIANEYALRSRQLSKQFTNINFLGGVTFKPNPHWEFSATVGTNFRLPTAIELASNGVHHGSFRHEKGNPDLQPEKGWVFDLNVQFKYQNFQTKISPYLYYFSNYIFLKPSGVFSPLPHGGQIYQFEQSKAVLSGVEFSLENTFFEKLSVTFTAEYIYNQQITENKSTDYPLPFSPPANAFLEINYLWKNNSKNFKNTLFFVNNKTVLQQNRIAQNEQPTDGFSIFGAGISTNLSFNKTNIEARLQTSNIFNTRYYNHTSFYRALEIPEMGRNIQLMITLPFGNE